MTAIWKFVAGLGRGLFVKAAAVPEDIEIAPKPQEECPEEKEREETEFERYCEEQRELNAIDTKICAEHGWPAEEGWPAIPPSARRELAHKAIEEGWSTRALKVRARESNMGVVRSEQGPEGQGGDSTQARVAT